MGLDISAAGDPAAVKAAADTAQAAHDLAENARQMVINRDAKLNQAATDATMAVGKYTTLEQLASSYEAALTASQADRASLHAQIDALKIQLAAVQTTPGPKGDKGDKGATGDKGLTGDVGPAGTANLAVCARPIGALVLGASTTVTLPWSRTMPNTTYQCQFAHSAVIDAANVTITVTTKTTTSVTVTVKSVGLALVAGTIVGTGW